MKPTRERPSVWYVIVTLAAMFYLSFVSKVLVGMLNLSRSVDQDQSEAIVTKTAVAFFGLLVIFAWCFLIRDLIRQFFRFLPEKNP